MWGAVVFILNGVVFVLIGLQLASIEHDLSGVDKLRLVGYGAVCSALVVVLRMVWLYPGARLSYFIRQRLLKQSDQRPSGRELLVFGWSGMRGVVSLAAAIALPVALQNGAPFPQRNLLVYLTFSVVVATLLVQGLTLAPLIRALGLGGGMGLRCEQQEARRISLQAALEHLQEERGARPR